MSAIQNNSEPPDDPLLPSPPDVPLLFIKSSSPSPPLFPLLPLPLEVLPGVLLEPLLGLWDFLGDLV